MADPFPPGVLRLEYRSLQDGAADWALAWPGDRRADWVVHLHGHGSHGDQIFVREDIRDRWLPRFRQLGLGILCPNLRDNAWMSPPAVRDLHDLLDRVRRESDAKRFFFFSGSMGGTGNLVYAARHPEDVAAAVAMCPATDIMSYCEWLEANPGGVRDEIRRAIVAAYGGPPGKVPGIFERHSALRSTVRLKMPLLIIHGDKDEIIPVEQSRELANRLAGSSGFDYHEIPGGDHDSPLERQDVFEWLAGRVSA